MTPDVRPATPGDRARVVETAVAAFAADPVLRYQFPDDAQYRHQGALFFGALFDKRVAAGTVWVAADGLAVSMWDPPGATGSSDLSGLDPEARARVDTYDAAVHAALPSGPSWYLGVLASHPDAAGRGLGHAAMSAGMDVAAASGLPCVLETSKPANLAYYARTGWEVVDVIDSPVRTWVLRVDPVTPLARR